jgi:hypothetical protein
MRFGSNFARNNRGRVIVDLWGPLTCYVLHPVRLYHRVMGWLVNDEVKGFGSRLLWRCRGTNPRFAWWCSGKITKHITVAGASADFELVISRIQVGFTTFHTLMHWFVIDWSICNRIKSFEVWRVTTGTKHANKRTDWHANLSLLRSLVLKFVREPRSDGLITEHLGEV